VGKEYNLMTRVVRLTPRDSDTASDPRLGSAALSPFHFTSNPMLSWLAGPYGDILTELRTGVVGGAGALVLTGEVGTGKTMLANTVAEFLRPNGVALGRLDYPSDNPADFCQAVGEVFGWQDVRSETFFPRAQQFLEETHARDARALLIVEEAQRVGRHVLAHIAQLVNLSRRIGGGRGSPLTVLLVGQDDLTAVLDSPENAAMKSVVKACYRLRPLTEDEVQKYIQHQLIIASAPRDLFTPPALKRVAEISRGIPRVINTLCHRAVIEAAQQGVSSIGPKLVRASVEELIPARGPGLVHTAKPAPATAVTAPSARTGTRKTRRGERAAIAVVVLLVTFLGGYAVHYVRRPAAVVKSAAPPTPQPLSSTQTPAPPPSTEVLPRPETWTSQPVSVPPTPPVEAPRPATPASARATNPPATQERAVVRPAVPTTTAPAPTPAPPRSTVPPRLETSASQPLSVAPTPPVEATRPAAPASARGTNPPATQERAVVRPAVPTPTAPAPTPAYARPAPAREPSVPPGQKAEPDPTAVIDWLLRDAPRSAN
jgi:type II secretory pathway predicted ATPase ExeA